MKVLLITTSIDPATQKGIARYSLELFNGLKNYCEVDLLVTGSTGVGKYLEIHSLLFFKLLNRVMHYDVVHAIEPLLGIYLPILTRHSVVTFNDLFALTWHKKWKFENLVDFYFRTTSMAASRVSRIISISSLTATEVTRYLKVPSEKIDIINLGVDNKFQPLPKHAKHIPTIGFFANFGYRKRVDIAIEVFRKVRQSGIECQLVLAGGNIPGTVYERLFDIDPMIKDLDKVVVLGHVPENELVALYNSFDVFLFPSEVEGFGLPILEAQRCGIPVLTRKNASIPTEVTRAAITCSGIDKLTYQICRLLTEPSYHQKISQAGIEYASQFTWDNVVEKTLRVYNKVAGA